MKITSKSKTAIKALIIIGTQEDRLSVREISEKGDISVRYLEQIVAQLKKGGLVDSVKGAGGGYAIAKPVEDIRVWDIIDVTEGIVLFADESNETICDVLNQHVFKPVDEMIANHLKNVTLKTLIDDFQAKNHGGYMYYI